MLARAVCEMSDVCCGVAQSVIRIGGPRGEDELPMSKKNLRSLQQSNDKLLRNLEYVLYLWLRAVYGCDIANSGTELDALKAHSPTRRSRYFTQFNNASRFSKMPTWVGRRHQCGPIAKVDHLAKSVNACLAVGIRKRIWLIP